MTRRPFICGNWKLNHRLDKTRECIQALSSKVPDDVDVGIAPVATTLMTACEIADGSSLKIGGQNVFHKSSGAYTGEWSVAHLVELGCEFAIVGHSERRQYFGETNESVGKKTRACFKGGIVPIACVGETLEQRDSGEMQDVLDAQVEAILNHLKEEWIPGLVLAYEPIWAIGTGKTASPEQAQEVHQFIRMLVAKQFGEDNAQEVRIQYGGSVKSSNIKELMAQADVDGALVGGASLEPADFLAICEGAIG